MNEFKTDLKALVPVAEFWRAVETYLQVAYETIPTLVQKKIDQLKMKPDADLYDAAEFEAGSKSPQSGEVDSRRLALRLGNRFYPHMKLLIQCPPLQKEYLFAADTHDQHICPKSDSREYAAYCELMVKNKSIARDIEAKWAENGLPIFKTYLKKKLEEKIAKKS